MIRRSHAFRIIISLGIIKEKFNQAKEDVLKIANKNGERVTVIESEGDMLIVFGIYSISIFPSDYTVLCTAVTKENNIHAIKNKRGKTLPEQKLIQMIRDDLRTLQKETPYLSVRVALPKNMVLFKLPELKEKQYRLFPDNTDKPWERQPRKDWRVRQRQLFRNTGQKY